MVSGEFFLSWGGWVQGGEEKTSKLLVTILGRQVKMGWQGEKFILLKKEMGNRSLN